jgi:ABC-type Fe3+ transport system permease subunit
MSNKKNKMKIFLGVIVTILLGFIGSGLWEVVGRSILNFCSFIVIKIITLGQTTLLDYIYKDMGKGLSEHYSINAYYFPLLLFTIVVICVLDILRRKIKKYLSKSQKEQKITPVDKEKRLSKLNKLVFYLILLYIFLFIVSFSDYFVVNYKDRTRTHFKQCVTICAPYITEKENNLLLSEFALIKSKADYINLNNKIKDIAQQYGLDLPKFNPL